MTKTIKINRMSRKRKRLSSPYGAIFERKRFALVSTNNTATTAGIVNNLTNGIVGGDDISQRSGDQIHILSHTYTVRSSAITVNQSFRHILFRDNMNRGTTPTVLEVLNTANFMSQYNPTSLQQKRFTILADFMLDCNVAGESIKSRTIRLPGQVVFYNGQTAVASANGPGAIFALEIGDSLTGLYDFSYEPIFVDA